MTSQPRVQSLGRRDFLKCSAAIVLGSGVAARGTGALAAEASPLISRIERSIIFEGRKGPNDWAWFHPRACMAPTAAGPLAVMTMQTASGSDYFGPVHWTTSADLGKTWSPPEPIPGMGRSPVRPGLTMGVCDVVPEYHAKTGTVLAMGHNVYYEPGRLAQPQESRWPVYAVRDAAGAWSAVKRLVWDDPRGSAIYTCGCAQRVVLPDGDLLIALSFGPKDRQDRMVTSVRCGFDGRKVAIRQVGNTLELRAGRGLLEPSLCALDGRYSMTIRAEDNRGYVSTSEDGLHWSPIRPWAWDDGEPLTMSTTQQHWLPHGEALYLVYTRKAKDNVHVMRWRSPLFLAEVDRRSMRLRRDTEQVVLPLIGDGVKDARHVAQLGNFHVTAAAPDQSWVTVGECLPYDRWRGDVLLARVHWARPNRLAVLSSS